jgi:hypothetical protein
MTATDPRQALLDFLDQKVFLPAISADPANYATTGDRRLLESVRKRVTTTRLKYQTEYKTATDVKLNFFQDLDSPFGQALAGDMFLLKLKRFEDMQKDFTNLCETLGV